MKKYNVHFTGWYCYDVVVEAEDEDEAEAIAASYEPSESDICYEPGNADVWETGEDDEVTYGN